VLLDGQAVGFEAKAMLGKTPGSIQAIRPMKDGVIADFEITEAMLRYFISKVHKRSWGYKPRVVIAVPSGITTVEKRAVRNSAERAGARRVYLIEEPRAAGIGVGLPVEEPTASMVCDIGGGTTEVAILSLGDIVTSTSIRVAGDEMDEAITNHMKRTYNLLIGEQTAERIKIEIGSAYPLEKELTMEVRGRDLIAGLPRRAIVNSEEIREAVKEPIDAIVGAVKLTLEQTQPELAADLVTNGLVMCGGGSLLRGIDKVIAEETGLPVRIADDPVAAVCRGTGLFLERLDFWKRYLEGDDESS
jgi:rod shape-determining protein MreB